MSNRRRQRRWQSGHASWHRVYARQSNAAARVEPRRPRWAPLSTEGSGVRRGNRPHGSQARSPVALRQFRSGLGSSPIASALGQAAPVCRSLLNHLASHLTMIARIVKRVGRPGPRSLFGRTDADLPASEVAIPPLSREPTNLWFQRGTRPHVGRKQTALRLSPVDRVSRIAPGGYASGRREQRRPGLRRGAAGGQWIAAGCCWALLG